MANGMPKSQFLPITVFSVLLISLITLSISQQVLGDFDSTDEELIKEHQKSLYKTQKALDTAQKALDTAQKALDETQKEKYKAIATVENALDKTQKVLEETQKEKYKAIATAKNALAKVNRASLYNVEKLTDNLCVTIDKTITKLEKEGIEVRQEIKDILANNCWEETLPSSPDIFSTCSKDWYITGYYTPVESEYSGDFTTVLVGGVERQYRSDFLADVTIEGWGRTLSGDYLGWYQYSYHLSNYPLDAKGNKLVVGSVAVDPQKINLYGRDVHKLIIPTLQSPWNEIIFNAVDVGPSIIGKHIDVFTGEGKQAEEETFRITRNGNTVCTN